MGMPEGRPDGLRCPGANSQTDGPFEPDPDNTGVGIGRSLLFNLSTFRVSTIGACRI